MDYLMIAESVQCSSKGFKGLMNVMQDEDVTRVNYVLLEAFSFHRRISLR